MKLNELCLFGSQVGPINHKRTLAFLNHFITHSVRFLNRFSCVCEEVSIYHKSELLTLLQKCLQAQDQGEGCLSP